MYCEKPLCHHLWRILHTIRLATGTDVMLIIVTNLVRPRVEIGLGRREIFDNEEISFECVGDGYPTPSIQVYTLYTLLSGTT